VCGAVPFGFARCNAEVITPAKGKPTSEPAVSYTATQLQAAYGVAGGGTAGSGPLVAVVDAYDSPDAASHLAAYRTTMGLPLCAGGGVACLLTTYDQRGSTSNRPGANTGWAQEIDLDVQLVSALCPTCRIALVEADSNSYDNLAAAVDLAGGLAGVVAISNSYGGSEFPTEAAFAAAHYDKPGIVITVSSGDAGYGVEFPAAAPAVVAVGGTALRLSGSGWSETAWSGAGSGCSSYVPKPAWQAAIATTCGNRLVSDVSAVADPNTGVKVYTTGSSGTGWYVFGGTSVASPVVAALYAGSPGPTSDGSALYGTSTGLYDVLSGSNGRCTSGRTTTNALLCTAGPGWDGPTGNGTPRAGTLPR
jgi:subtilase family serine protease